jgi:hypothetical protein
MCFSFLTALHEANLHENNRLLMDESRLKKIKMFHFSFSKVLCSLLLDENLFTRQ